MQQLRLFPREHRLALALVVGDREVSSATARRLRRSRRLEVLEIGLDELVATVGSRGAGQSSPPCAAVLALGEDEALSSVDLVSVAVGDLAPVPLIVVTPTASDAALSMLDSGVQDVIALEGSTGSTLERAVLSAIYRTAAGRRSGQRSGDPLTGLPTRTALSTVLPETTLTRRGIELALLYCDLDRFKVINDTHGHATGDAILVEAATRLSQAVRSSDLVVRIGGDEFVVAIGGSGPRFAGLADEVAERIVKAFGKPFEVGEHSFSVSVSVGLAMHREGEDLESLLARADRALYLAKRRGKSRVARYDEHLDRAVAQHANSTEVLREGLRRDLLGAELRPVVHLSRRRLEGHLYRPTWGEAPGAMGRAAPTRRVTEVALDAGVTTALFRWTLARAVADTRARDLGSVDASCLWVEMPRSALVGGAGRVVQSAARRSPDANVRLVLVIDEGDLGESAALRAGLLELARSGVRVAIGRFGASGASLCLMERHPFEAVWLDPQIVDGLASCRIRRAKLTAVAEMAAALGQRVVIDRPLRSEDVDAAADLADLVVVDRAVDLTSTSVALSSPARERVVPITGVALDVPRVPNRR